MDLTKELACGGVAPTGPVSAWPRSRHEQLLETTSKKKPEPKKVTATTGRMARGLMKNAATAMTKGRVAPAVRAERWETCQSCPAFIESSKRCQDCGCMMNLKTWINGDAKQLCPRKKWAR